MSTQDNSPDLHTDSLMGMASQGDVETHVQRGVGMDGVVTEVINQLTEAKSADARFGKYGWYVAAFMAFWGLTVTIAYIKLSNRVLWMRIPYVRMSDKAPGVLVQASPDYSIGFDMNDNGKRESIKFPPSVVQAEMENWMTMRFGVSAYHGRVLWKKLSGFYLDDPQRVLFEAWQKQQNTDLVDKGYNWMRRIDVISFQIDSAKPIGNGGTEFNAQVTYSESDIKLDELTPFRQQTYVRRVIFRMGEIVKESNPDLKILYLSQNPYNLRMLQISEPNQVRNAKS